MIVNSKHKDLDGLQLGEDYIKKLNSLMQVKQKDKKLSKSKELLKVLPFNQLKK